MSVERDHLNSRRFALGIDILSQLDVEPEFHRAILRKQGFIWEIHGGLINAEGQPVYPLDSNDQILVRLENHPSMLGIVIEANPASIKLAFLELKGDQSEEIAPAYYEQTIPVAKTQGCLIELINSLKRDKDLDSLWNEFLNNEDLTDRQKSLMKKAHNKLFNELKDSQESWVNALKEDPLLAMSSWVTYGSTPKSGSN